MLPRSKILPHFPYVKKTRENFEMNAKEGRRLAVLEIDTIFNNLLCIFSNTTSRYIIRRLLRNQYQSRNEQAAALYDIIKTDLDINISIRRIASINLVDNSNLSKYIRNPQRKKLGRKPKLTQEQEFVIIEWIKNKFNQKNPVTPKELRMEIFERFDILVSKNWYRTLFNKYPNQLMQSVAHPQDEQRIFVTKTTAKIHILNLIRYVNNVPTELILNLDEASSSEWEDKRSKIVIVPYENYNKTIEFPVDRCAKKITICATISMAGDVLPPLIISHRKTIDEEILNSGWRSGQDYIYYYNEKSFMTKAIFQDYIIHTIIQYIDRTRESMKLKDYPAVLLSDNCPSHRCEEIYKELANHNIRLITFPPHTTNLFQPLDLVTFSSFKLEKAMVNSKYKKRSQSDMFYRNLVAMEKATTSSNNRSAFYRAGLEVQASVIPNVANIREKYLNEIVEKSNLIDGDYLSNKVEFGWINKCYFDE